MKKSKSYILVLLLSLSFFSFQINAKGNFFKDTDNFLKKYVIDGKIDYSSIEKNREELLKLTEQIKDYSFAGKSNQEIKAFWINAYNILVIKGIIDEYPVNSPMDIPGFFDSKKHLAAGEKVTLNQIENKKIRAVYHDARIHFVLVCAAVSCPPITNFAYQADKLDGQLQKQTIKAINDPDFIKVDKNKRTVAISEIFKWYSEDFKSNGKGYIDYINKYRKEKIPSGYKVEFYTYNWTLNKADKSLAQNNLETEDDTKKKTLNFRL